MGQRLVVTITKNEKELAAIYYHWSAYTYSALLETRDIINCIYNSSDETEEEMLLRLVKFCYENGGGISGGGGERDYISALYPNETFEEEGYSRNNGLIALSKDGIQELQHWSEGDVFIQLDSDTVDFCVYSGYESLDEYIEERKPWDEDFEAPTLEEIPKIDCCLGFFEVNDIDYIIDRVDSIGNEYLINCGGEICELIA